MGQGSARLYNLISILFLILTVVVIVVVGGRFAQPAPQVTVEAVIQPTLNVLPTITLTFTPSNTPLATETPTLTITPSVTITETGTQRPIPTSTASLTNTPEPTVTITPIVPTTIATQTPSITPSLTVQASLTITNTPPIPATVPPSPTTPPPTSTPFTPQPLVDVPSPYPFTLREGQPVFTANFANAAGCSWQGIGGQVFDVNDQPLLGISVHVFGSGVDVSVSSGSNTIYGIAGWEVPLATAVTANSYLVELRSSAGTAISEQITVTFTADCARNLVLLNFKQNRPF